MSTLPTLNFPTGKIGFAAMVRGWDEEPRNAFRVELLDRPTLYGEWRSKFIDNGNDFNVEIVSVGYGSESLLGSAYPAHRQKFSGPEQNIVEDLIRALFADQSAKPSMAPFATKNARFLGAVVFAPGWILRSA
jgi:hypothetical protein